MFLHVLYLGGKRSQPSNVLLDRCAIKQHIFVEEPRNVRGVTDWYQQINAVFSLKEQQSIDSSLIISKAESVLATL